jgi:RluA family pseudouridine synthase
MRAIRLGSVRLDAKAARRPDIRVSAGQELYVPWEDPSETAPVRNYGEIPIIWEDDSVCFVNKPADLLVQPEREGGDSVVTRVWSKYRDRREKGFSPAAVHRLDRNTTGILVVALTGGALRDLERLFKERVMSKSYVAVVVGRTPKGGEIRAPLLKNAEENLVVVHSDGKEARTRYRTIAGDEDLSLVEILLLTGRTHQARVHMAHEGFPILGDQKYGDRAMNALWRKAGPIRRPLLHAWSLEFPEELPGAHIKALAGQRFTAPWPDDVVSLIGRREWSPRVGRGEFWF